jgi:hypothetical protein
VSERMTVVFDDIALYRRLKIAAVERGVPVKRIIEDAVAHYLGAEATEAKPFDWDAFQRWQAEGDDLVSVLPDDGVDDYSDVKKHLYGRREPRPLQMLAEERAEYDAR